MVRSIILFVLFSVFLSCSNPSQKKDISSVNLIRGDIRLCGGEDFGEVDFELSCSQETRKDFELGISLLHSFEYEEAEKAFAKVIDSDPSCVMAYWGVAMSNFHSLWLQSGTEYLEKGSRILDLAKSIKSTARERDYLEAIGAFYSDWESKSREMRVQEFEQKMERLYETYSFDKEAAIFYALALTAAANPADKTYQNQKKAGKILESIFPDQPNHPGIAHYIIHCYDYPELAEMALPTARKYAQIAPSSAHAQHMPSHIFTQLGLWRESINSNINSISSAQCYGQTIDSAGHWDEELHGMDYLVYAYLQLGDNQSALEQSRYLMTFKKVFPENFKVAYAIAAIPARIALENKNWNDAINLKLPKNLVNWRDFPWQLAISHFARGLGFANIGNTEQAQAELDTLEFLQNQLKTINDPYKANQVAIQSKTLIAWIQLSKGNHDQAIALMKEASDMEYQTSKHPVTPSEVLPAIELLGDMNYKLGNYEAALEAYKSDLQQHPNRFNGLYGAAKSAFLKGDTELARNYLHVFLETINPDVNEREEIIDAKKLMQHLSSDKKTSTLPSTT